MSQGQASIGTNFMQIIPPLAEYQVTVSGKEPWAFTFVERGLPEVLHKLADVMSQKTKPISNIESIELAGENPRPYEISIIRRELR